MAPPARRRYTRAVAARPGKARSQGSAGVKQRSNQRKRLTKRRQGRSS
jgi:hypothetical protein